MSESEGRDVDDEDKDDGEKLHFRSIERGSTAADGGVGCGPLCSTVSE